MYGWSELFASPESKYKKARDIESTLHVRGGGQQQLKTCAANLKHPIHIWHKEELKHKEGRGSQNIPEELWSNGDILVFQRKQ